MGLPSLKAISLPALPAFPALPGIEKEWARAFVKGLIFLAIFVGLLIGWLSFRGEDIAAQRAERLASKTAIISRLEASLASEPEEETLFLEPQTQTIPEATETEPSPQIPVPEDSTEPVAAAPPSADAANFERFSKAFQPVAGRAPIAVVISDFGLSAALADQIIAAAPEQVTLSFSPYSPALQELIGKTGNFERWLTLPLEGESLENQDSGPLTLYKNVPLERTQDIMNRLLSIAQAGFAGFATNRGHDFSLADVDTNPALPLLAQSGFGLLDGRAVGTGFAREYAQKNFIPYAHASEWIDRAMTQAQIETKLQTIERLAQMNGGAVLMVEPTPLALSAIQSWSAGLADRGLQLAPLSYLAQ